MQSQPKAIAATKEQMVTITSRLNWAKRHKASYNGIPYHDEIRDGGAEVTLYVPTDLPEERRHSDRVLQNAIGAVRRERDLIGLQIVSVPNEWLEDSGWLNSSLADRIVHLAHKQGMQEAKLLEVYESRLKSTGENEKAQSRLLTRFQKSNPTVKVEALISAGITADQVAKAIWGQEVSWASVKASYARDSKEIDAVWESSGYEVESSGGGCYAAFKVIDGVQFMITDYLESRMPNPDFRLSAGAYSAEDGEYLNFIREVGSLKELESAIHAWAVELQPALAGDDADACNVQQSKAKGSGPRP